MTEYDGDVIRNCRASLRCLRDLLHIVVMSSNVNLRDIALKLTRSWAELMLRLLDSMDDQEGKGT